MLGDYSRQMATNVKAPLLYMPAFLIRVESSATQVQLEKQSGAQLPSAAHSRP
jgi:hypothetical protein